MDGKRKGWTGRVLLVALLAVATLLFLRHGTRDLGPTTERPAQTTPREARVDSTRSARSVPNWAVLPGAARRRIAGRVVREGVPVADAEVFLVSTYEQAHGRLLAKARSGKDGTFDLGSFPETTYRLTAMAQESRPATRHLDLRDPTLRPPSDALVIELGACEVHLAVRIEDAGGELLTGAHLRIGRGNEGLQVASIAVPSGAGEVCARAGDYVEARVSGYGRIIGMVPAGSRASLTLTLGPEGSIQGRALDEEGRPIADALVWISALNGEPATYGDRTTTDEAGVFELRELPARRYLLQSLADDAMLLVPVTAEVRPTEETRVDLKLARTVVVEGRVLDAEGEPIPGAAVLFGRIADGMTSRTGIADASGRFGTTHVPPGEVSVLVSDYAGTSPATLQVPTTGLSDVEIRVVGRRQITGRVVIEGRGVEGVTVTSTCGPSAVSEKDGGFRLLVQGLGFGTCRAEARDGERAASPVTFDQRDTSRALELVLLPTVRAKGRVLSVEHRPVGGARVMLRGVGGPGEAVAMTSDDGVFALPGLLPGRWQVSVGGVAEMMPFRLVSPASAEIEIAESDLSLTLVVDTASGTLTGKVRRDGSPVADAKVMLRGSDHEARAAQTDEDGGFRFREVPRGEYGLTVQADGGWAEARATVPSPQPIIVELALGATLKGTVQDETGVMIFALPTGNPDAARSLFTTGARFSMTGLPPGSATVMAVKGGRRVTRQVDLTADRPAMVELRLPPGEQTLRVHVADETSGAPLAGVRCHLAFDQTFSMGIRSSNEQGDLSFVGVAAGTGELRCWGGPGQQEAAVLAVDTSISVAPVTVRLRQVM